MKHYSMDPFFLQKMPPKLRNKIILESQELVSDVIEAAREGLIPTMVEPFIRNTIDFL